MESVFLAMHCIAFYFIVYYEEILLLQALILIFLTNSNFDASCGSIGINT